MSPACFPALLLAAGIAAVAAPRLASSPFPWSPSAKVRARVLRFVTAALAGALAVALALSLVGVSGQAADSIDAIRIWALAAMVVAAFLIWRSRGSRSSPRSSSGAESL
jgi:hypothetical protein